MKAFTIILEDDLAQFFEEYAKSKGYTRGQFVRFILKELRSYKVFKLD